MTKNRIILIIIFLTTIIILAAGTDWVLFIRKAHSTFENYYTFRGCTELVEKTDNYGLCKTSSGQTIKIVKFQDKWYLDGDLPCGFLCF